MKISLIVPVFNKEDAVPFFYQAVRRELAGYEIEIIFINDGSKDATEVIINSISVSDTLVKAISFTRNFGKEPALFAGLEHASGDAVILIDVDLQDPITVIPRLIEKWINSADVVLAKRIDRSKDSHLKRKTAESFYRLHNKISYPKIEVNVGDFRLMSREVVEYAIAERVAGRTKFNAWKLWNLALKGITSFSTFPLRILTYIGLFIAGCSFSCITYMIFNTMMFGNPVKGYTSIMVSMLFLGGVKLIGVGVLGEYIGRIYIETKKRPRFIAKNSK